MFSYDVLSEEEVQKAREFPLLPDGIYDFVVIEAKFKYSQSGNPMIALKIRIIHEGQEFNVFDYLIATKMMAWKTKHFCDSTGLQKEYAEGHFNERLAAGRRGTCAIKSVPARPKNDGTGGMYNAKNEVEDYLSSEALNKASAANPFAPPPAKPAAPESEPFVDNDIPF